MGLRKVAARSRDISRYVASPNFLSRNRFRLCKPCLERPLSQGCICRTQPLMGCSSPFGPSSQGGRALPFLGLQRLPIILFAIATGGWLSNRAERR